MRIVRLKTAWLLRAVASCCLVGGEQVSALARWVEGGA